jgi:hypothetical protein
MMTVSFHKPINVLGISVLLEKTITYSPYDVIPDAIYMKKPEVEQEIFKTLCWRQFSESLSMCVRLQDYFARIAKQYAKDYILTKHT